MDLDGFIKGVLVVTTRFDFDFDFDFDLILILIQSFSHLFLSKLACCYKTAGSERDAGE